MSRPSVFTVYERCPDAQCRGSAGRWEQEDVLGQYHTFIGEARPAHFMQWTDSRPQRRVCPYCANDCDPVGHVVREFHWRCKATHYRHMTTMWQWAPAEGTWLPIDYKPFTEQTWYSIEVCHVVPPPDPVSVAPPCMERGPQGLPIAFVTHPTTASK